MSEETKKAEHAAPDANAAELSEQDLDQVAGGAAQASLKCSKCGKYLPECRCRNLEKPSKPNV